MAQSLPVSSKRLQVHLVQPPINGPEVQPPLGILGLAPGLEADGHQVHIVDLNLRAKQGLIDPSKSLRHQLIKALPRNTKQVDLVGITTWSYNFDVTMEFVEEVRKEHPQAPIVLGGPHVTFVDRQAMEAFDAIDFVIRDEGDESVPRLARAIAAGADPDELARIPGLTWRRGAEIVRNPSGGVFEDLDALPYPAFHLIDLRDYTALNPVLVLEAGRGCPYNCNFCSTSNMFSRKYRVKSAPRLVDEIEWAMKQSGTNRFELLHDNLVADKKYVLSLCDEIRQRNIDVDWSCTSRPDNITEQVAQKMFLAGCCQVFFGVETLSAERQKWTGKKLVPSKVHAAIELTARQHLLPTAGIIVGFPDESDEELNDTVAAAVRWATEPEIKADVSTAVLRYYPGADLFSQAHELRYDPIAAAPAAAIPGYQTRQAWREMTDLFPLQSIHTSQAETRTNMLRMQFVRTLMRACPLTFRGLLEIGGQTPKQLLDAMQAGRPDFEMLSHPDRGDTIWNETVEVLGGVIRGLDQPELTELLDFEVPFWRTRAISPPLEQLEHVVHKKRFQHEQLLQRALGRREQPPEQVRAQYVLGARAGAEVFVAVTDRPQAVLRQLQEGLRQGLPPQQQSPQR